MSKILICYFLFALAVGSSFCKETEEVKADLIVVENIEEFKAKNNLLNLIPLEKVENVNGAEGSPYGVVRYTLGNRVAGDRLVAISQDGAQWSAPQNVKLTLQYPVSGVGAIVSHVQILVDQTSNIGRGYVINGGIGQRQITVVVEAQSTLKFVYQAEFYGY